MTQDFPFASVGSWTPVPNIVFDSIMPRISSGALRILLLVIRNTKGYDQRHCGLTYADIKGGTGIKSDTTISDALDELCGDALFGFPVLLKKTGEAVGVTSHKASKFAINRKFPRISNAPKNGAHAPKNGASNFEATPKNGASDAPKNGASYPNVKNSFKEPNTNGCENARENSPPEKGIPYPSREVPKNPWPDEIEDVARDVCKIPLTFNWTMKAQLKAFSEFVVAEHGGDLTCASAETKRLFSAPLWTLPAPPTIDQLLRMWHRQKNTTPRPPRRLSNKTRKT